MGWIRSGYETFKELSPLLLVLILCLNAFLLFGGRDQSTPSDEDFRNELRAEIERIDSNFESISGNLGAAMDSLDQQGVELRRAVELTEELGSGIAEIRVTGERNSNLIRALIDRERDDRDLIVESGVITDRGKRILSSLQSTNDGSTD